MYIAIDQYGTVWRGLNHPRKDLCEKIGNSHAEKMYVDTETGGKHVGYVIDGLWLTVYKLERMEKPA